MSSERFSCILIFFSSFLSLCLSLCACVFFHVHLQLYTVSDNVCTLDFPVMAFDSRFFLVRFVWVCGFFFGCLLVLVCADQIVVFCTRISSKVIRLLSIRYFEEIFTNFFLLIVLIFLVLRSVTWTYIGRAMNAGHTIAGYIRRILWHGFFFLYICAYLTKSIQIQKIRALRTTTLFVVYCS